MINRQKTCVYHHIRQNFKVYILLSIAFTVGFGVSRMNPSDAAEIRSYVDSSEWFSVADGAFLVAVKQHMICVLIFLLSAFSVVGIPCVLFGIGWFGYCYGTAICGLAEAYGMKSVLMILCGVLPHLCLLLPWMFWYASFCANNSFVIFWGNFDWKKNVVLPVLGAVFSGAIICVIALIQAFIEPWLLSFIVM